MDRRQRGMRWLLAAPVVLLLATTAAAKRSHGENVHRADDACGACHTGDAASLQRDAAAARAALAGDLEARCNACHADEGASHKTGIAPKRPVPPTLPLAPDGTIGCATCHFMHGENNDFGAFLRVDNRRGALCLSCHELAELQ